jgi:hypothetical protein
MRKLLITAAALLAAGNALSAQSENKATGPLILHLPASTRALGLGGAYQLTSADPDVLFVNPVLLQNARGISVSMQRYGSASTLTTVTTSTDLNLGFGLQVLEYAPARAILPDDIGSPSALPERGSVSSGEVVGMVGYMRVIKRIRLGAAAKWAQHWGAGQSAGVAAFDVGSGINPLNWLMVTLAVQNIGGSFELGSADYDLPMRAVLNAATRPKVIGPLDVTLATRFSAPRHGDPSFGAGMEASYWPFPGLTFFGRVGVRAGTESAGNFIVTSPNIEQSHFTAGAGVSSNRLSLDYAWEPFREASDAHRIGFRVR